MCVLKVRNFGTISLVDIMSPTCYHGFVITEKGNNYSLGHGSHLVHLLFPLIEAASSFLSCVDARVPDRGQRTRSVDGRHAGRNGSPGTHCCKSETH